MQIILLALVFGLTCAQESVQDQVEGVWRSIYLAGTNNDKVDVNGDLRIYLRSLTCNDGPDCNDITMTFFTIKNGVCNEYNILATKQENGEYFAEYSGKNYVSVSVLPDGLIGLSNRNIDEYGVESKAFLVAGKRTALTPEEYAKFVDYVGKEGIPEQDIKYLPSTDICKP